MAMAKPGENPVKVEKVLVSSLVLDPANARCASGDLWLLGHHRLLCGDSTNPLDVDRLLNGNKPLLMVTDPPYGVNYDAEWRNVVSTTNGRNRTGKVANDDRTDWTEAWSLSPSTVCYVWHASSFTDVVMNSLRSALFEPRQMIIWNKSVMAISRSNYHYKHETCWYAVRRGSRSNWLGDKSQTTVWDAASPTHIMSGSKEEKTQHPTHKPIVLYETPIANHTNRGDGLYEPFGGSGTAFIAAEKMDRICFGMEIDPKYCDIIISRWEKFTGQNAILEASP